MVFARAQNTHHMDRLHSVEEKMCIVDEIWGSDNALRERMLGVNTQLQDLVRGIQDGTLIRANGNDDQRAQPNGNGDSRIRNRDNDQRNPYQCPTQFTKMEFPRFLGRDMLTWIHRCEIYFELDETPSEHKVKMASLHLDDESYQWHIAMERHWREAPPTWNQYVELLLKTFWATVRDSHGRLTHLRQTGSLADFNRDFDRISANLELTEEYLVDAYASALKPELEGPVRIFDPRKMIEARRLARMQELIFEKQDSKHVADRGNKHASGSSSVSYGFSATSSQAKNGLSIAGAHTKDQFGPSTQKLIESGSKNVPKQVKALSAEEEADHRARNLCFYCHDKFTRGHKCSQRQKMQLHFLAFEDNDEQETEVSVLEPDSEDIEDVPRTSLHAIQGVDNSEAMPVQGHFGKHPLQILIDSGSTHDFMDLKLAEKLGWRDEGGQFSSVEVAGGKRLKVYGFWGGFRWKMQGLEFVFDFRILDLSTYDLVLGLKWLKRIKNA